MKATEFAYWLQGMFELAEPSSLNAKQTELIRRHLAMVFLHDIDPSYPASQQQALTELHDGDDYDDPADDPTFRDLGIRRGTPEWNVERGCYVDSRTGERLLVKC